MDLNILVSIIVPCYNQGQYIDECLQSVLDQTHENWECILVNDGSTDDTKEKIEKWIARDSRFKYYYQENSGVSGTRNLGLKHASGKFIQFLDSDDVMHVDKIKLSLNGLQDKNYNLIVTNFKTFAVDIEKAIEHPNFLKIDFLNFKGILSEWGLNFNIPIHCGLFSADFFKDFRFAADLKGNEDWIMWLSFFKKEPVLCFVDKPLVYYRSHPASATKNETIMEDSYFKFLKHIRNLVSEVEYTDFLISLLSKKDIVINRLEKQIIKYQSSRGFKILKKVKENRFGKIIVKYTLRLTKRQ